MGQHRVAKETRREQRLPARLHIELTVEDGEQSDVGNTINISANGVYFKSRRYLAPLTVLGLRILLSGEHGRGRPERLDVRGVVVRVEPEEEQEDVQSYEVACFFMDTTPEFRERLGHYVQSNL